MKISMISDVHIKYRNDYAFNLLINFLKHEKVVNSDKVFLMGDIFDLICGPHEEYLYDFREVFDQIKHLMNKNVEVHYFEGNHDLHLEKLFDLFIEQNNLNKDKFVLHTDKLEMDLNGKKYYISHGDEIEIGNYTYKIYKKIIRSMPLEFVANYVMPYSVLDSLGKKASVYSRERNRPSPHDLILNKDSYRIAAINVASRGYDVIICGHNHIKDFFQGEIAGNKFVYVNNGYAQESKTFIHLRDDDTFEFVNLP